MLNEENPTDTHQNPDLLLNEVFHLKMRLRDYAKKNLSLIQLLNHTERSIFNQRESNRKLEEAHKASLRRIVDLEAILDYQKSLTKSD